MSAHDRLGEVLARLSGGKPAPAREIAAASKVRAMPEPLRKLFATSAEPALPGVQLFALDDYEDVNRQLPEGLVAFADDRSDRWFVLTETGAVVWLPRTDLRLGAARPVAPDLATFLKDVLAGERRWEDVEPAIAARDRVRELLLKPPPWIETRPAQPLAAVLAFAEANNLPRELTEMLEVSDGFLVPTSGAELSGLADIMPEPAIPAPVPGPGAVWAGRVPGGGRLLVLGIDLETYSSGDALAAPDGKDWKDATSVGPLSLAVLGWIEGGRQ